MLRSLQDVDARVREVSSLRTEVEDICTEKIPGVVQQSTLASQALAEALRSLREEVMQRFQAESVRIGEEVTTLRAEVSDLRRQMKQTLLIDLEERFSTLHSDLSAKAAGGMREAMANARRLAALEGKSEHPQALEDFSPARHAPTSSSSPGRSLKSSTPFIGNLPGSHREVSPGPAAMRRELTPPRAGREFTPPPSAGREFTPPGRGKAASHKAGAPVIAGRRVEWQLSADQINAACANAAQLGPLVSRELEVLGVKFRIKFYPGGSPLRQHEGFCSLYLLALMPIELHFRLFAGDHTSPVLEARNRATAKDIGRHDMCLLRDVLGGDGGTCVGVEFITVLPIQEDDIAKPSSQPPFRP